MISSCNGSNESDKNYQKACEELDYIKAWNIVEQLREEYVDHIHSWWSSVGKEKKAMNKYKTAYDYVLRSEVNFLLANGDEASAKRIMILLNEQKIDEDKKNEYIKEFVKLAISLDNDHVINLFAKNATLEDEELLTYLIHKNTIESSDKVLSMISHEFNNCEKPAPGLNNFYLSKKNRAYKHFNSRLNSILNLAISNHNQYLAKKTFGLYVQTMVVTEGRGGGKKYKGVVVDGNHSYVEFNNSEMEEAQKNYNNAVKSGAFK
jgi:hypothetical protein